MTFLQVTDRGGLTLVSLCDNFMFWSNIKPMKQIKYQFLFLLFQPLWLLAQTGGTCTSAFPIPLDGVKRNFTTSSSSASAVVCTNYTGSSPVTWFSFTTNAAAEMPLMDITAGDSSQCEIAMSTSCNLNNGLEAGSSMCFDDGWGLWAPAHNFTLSPNTTYYLRIKTANATTISITAQSHTPTNNLCSGATPVGSTPINDNNACNRPSSEVTPAQLCAYTIENTAFYQFYVASTGTAIINISSISCDNGAYNNSGGFQIGFFTGTCGALVPLSCTAGAGTNDFVQATTPSLPAGTKVYVAIDGDAGSNCQYSFNALNAFGVLSEAEFKNFSGWKNSSSNVLKWISIIDKNVHFVVERSLNGSDFAAIGEVSPAGAHGQAVNCKFEDVNPSQVCYYRVKQVASNGQITMSNTLRIERRNEKANKIRVYNPVRDDLAYEVDSDTDDMVDYTVSSAFGQVFSHGKLQLQKGTNKLSQAISNIPAGHYVLTLSSRTSRQSMSFIKLN
jgi:hypothetical protein